jgi:hypothetical protein
MVPVLVAPALARLQDQSAAVGGFQRAAVGQAVAGLHVQRSVDWLASMVP